MRPLLLLLLLLLTLCLPFVSCHSQRDAPNNSEAFSRPQADRREYFFGLLRTGPHFDKVKAEDGKTIQDGHMAHVLASIQSGELILTGPFKRVGDPKEPARDGATPGGSVRALLLFSTYDLRDVNEWVAADPALEAGVFKLEILTWIGPQGLTFKGRDALIQEIMQAAPKKAADRESRD